MTVPNRIVHLLMVTVAVTTLNVWENKAHGRDASQRGDTGSDQPSKSIPDATSSASFGDIEQGWQLWSQGQIDRAHEVAQLLLKRDSQHSQARHLLILALMFEGHDAAALEQYAQLDPEYGRIRELDQYIVNAHQNLGRTDRALQFAEQVGRPDGVVNWLKMSRDRPLRVSLAETTVVAFSLDQPLHDLIPALPIVINGQDYFARLDTGASYISMSPKMAQKFNIQTQYFGRGFANGRPTTTEKGLIDTLVIGDAQLQNVPVNSVAALTGGSGDFKIDELVIIGTNLLGQFLTTWDNEQQRLVLSPRQNPIARRDHFNTYVSSDALSMHFFMAPDHYLIAHGAFNNRDAVFFVDTGTVTTDSQGRQPGCVMPASSLEKFGQSQGPLSRYYLDDVHSVKLGPVQMDETHVLIRAGRDLIFGGVKLDANVGHGFLKNCVWTIDFDTRTWHLSRFRG